MKKTIGLFTPEQEALITNALFELINRKRKMPGIVKYLIRFIIKRIDNKKLNNLPDHWKNQLYPVVEAAFNREHEKLKAEIAKVLNSNIDIPGMSETSEQIVFEMFIKITTLAIEKYVIEKHQSPGA